MDGKKPKQTTLQLKELLALTMGNKRSFHI